MTFKWGQPSCVDVAEKRLETNSFGPNPADAPTLVLLHEGLGCCALWRDFPEVLQVATGCGVFIYSRAGYGMSDGTDLPRPISYMSDEARDVLPEVLDTIGFQTGALIGHSDGATISAIYAGHVPDPRIKGIVLMAPHFFAEDISLKSIQRAAEAYRNGDLKARLARYHKDPDQAFCGWNEAWLNPEFATWSVVDCLGGITVPVLAIQGVDDEYGTQKQVDEIAVRASVPVDIQMLEDCGHAPHIDQPGTTLTMMSAFVRDVLGSENTQSGEAIWRPSHAYHPGINSRHPEDCFAALTAGIQDLLVEDLPLTLAWKSAVSFLNEGFYWEAHEVLEPIWMACPQNSAEAVFVRSMIQFANARLKHAMGKKVAAEKLLVASRALHAEAMGRDVLPAFDQGWFDVVGFEFDTH